MNLDDFNDIQAKFLFPPAEALMPKSMMVKEEAKTVGGMNFLKVQRLQGMERIELMGAANKRSKFIEPVTPTGNISDYMVNNWKRDRLIYCRFGEKYMKDLQKRQNSALAPSNQPLTNLGGASYLLNLKKIIEENNEEQEKQKKPLPEEGLGKKGAAKKEKKKEEEPVSFYKLKDKNDNTLLFESRFESGNLLAAIKVADNEYDLVLQNDINTNGHT